MDHRTVRAATEFVEGYDDEEPFFLTASFQLPHPPWFEDEEFADRYQFDDVGVPESFDEDFHRKPSFQKERADHSECSLTREETGEIRYNYRTMVSRVDDYIGALLDTLVDRGFDGNTFVILSSDHGDMQGAHRLNKKGVIAYDDILKVPLIVRPPEREAEQRSITDPVSIASIPSTIADVTTGTVPEEFECESLLSRVDGKPMEHDQYVFFEHEYAYWGEHPYVGVRTPQWKYVKYVADDVAELYEIAEDPHEMENLAPDARYDTVSQALDKRIEGWWSRTDGDWEEWERSIDSDVDTEVASATWESDDFTGTDSD